MEAIELKCPCCGGNIDIDNNEIIKCTYCGATLINPVIKGKQKKSIYEIGISNIEEIEEEIYKIKNVINVEANSTWRSGQEQFYYGYPTSTGFKSSSNTRVVNRIYITDEMLEEEDGLYMFDEVEQEYIRYYIFCAKTLTKYTNLLAKQQHNNSEELISQIDSIMLNFEKEKRKIKKQKLKIKN